MPDKEEKALEEAKKAEEEAAKKKAEEEAAKKTDPAEIIKKLKAETVSKKDFEELQDKYNKTLLALAEGEKVEVPPTEAPLTEEERSKRKDVLRKELYGRDNSLNLPCAFCHFGAAGECLCAIEMAGKVKPASCSLYPIRVTKLTGGGLALNVHHWDICKPAFEKGEREGIRVYQFLKNPLTKSFGEDFYDALCAAAKHLIG